MSTLQTGDDNRRIPLRGREDLSIFWDNHLRVAFEQSAPHDLPAMTEASLAHVTMLKKTGALAPDRADTLLRGLLVLWDRWGSSSEQQQWQPRISRHTFDGSVEDPYYLLEQQLAEECGISTADLDVQLARSRNDLDAGVFRMILRRGILDVLDLLTQTISDLLEKASAMTEVLIIGHTHRRPAQPTTIAHVLSGLAEALLSQAEDLLGVYDEVNISPLGSAAFTGTDIAIDASQVADLLGFDSSFTASYEAVAGAEHFMRLIAVHGRITATGARWARVLQEWMNLGWVVTPDAFTQGSSIMPQKKNPVVLEHMVSMAGAGTGDLTSVFTTIGAGWYEDSNNATTDVQKHLWTSTDRVVRFLRMLDGLILELEPLNPPTPEEIVRSGATTTAVAEALATRGVPWRSAHDVVGTLFRQGDPTTWNEEQVAAALTAAEIADEHGELAMIVMNAGAHPQRILERQQAGSPGRAALQTAVGIERERRDRLSREIDDRRRRVDDAREELLATARTAVGNGADARLSVIGNINLDVIVHGASAFPAAGTEEIVPDIEARLGGSAGISALRSAQLGTTTCLVSRMGEDPSADVVTKLAEQPCLDLYVARDSSRSGITVVSEKAGAERAFLSSLGAMASLDAGDVPDAALQAPIVLFSGYFLLPGLQGEDLSRLLDRVHHFGGLTALDTGHPDGGWDTRTRSALLETVLSRVDLFLPNAEEVCGLANASDPTTAAELVQARTGATVIAKLGAHGAVVADGERLEHLPAPEVTPLDTTGAGDTFNAALITRLLRGAHVTEAARFAVETASRIIAAAPGDRESILRGLARR